MDKVITLGVPSFSLHLDDRGETSATASVEAMTLVRLRITSRDVALTSWFDVENGERSETLDDVPLVDLAYWIASYWTDLIYGLELPRAVVARSVTPAQRWSISSTYSAQDRRTYEWAKAHAIEFAATDYTFPNLVFQRRDDFMEVSWDPRPTAAPGNTVVFDTKPGSVILTIDQFVSVARSVLDWVAKRTQSSTASDERLRAIRSLLSEDAKSIGTRALQSWFGATSLPKTLTVDELTSLGTTGTSATPSVMFLRSAAGVISAGEAIKILKRVPSGGEPATAALAALAGGLDSTIDPAVPWDSGLQLARTVRLRLGRQANEYLDIEDALKTLKVSVVSHVFSASDIEGACFLTSQQIAVAFYNPRGRLAKSLVGRRTTLSHELCHLLFDAPKQALGQLDLRVGLSGASLIEKRANAFAAELLLPREAVFGVSEKGRISAAAVAELARRFQVSKWVVAHQAENQELRVG